VVINFDKITSTIALFERTLVTPSRYDNFLHGDENASSPKRRRLDLETIYKIKGCVVCP